MVRYTQSFLSFKKGGVTLWLEEKAVALGVNNVLCAAFGISVLAAAVVEGNQLGLHLARVLGEGSVLSAGRK